MPADPTRAPTVITSLDEVTPRWLTTVLRNAGALGGGSVAGIDIAAGVTSFCTVARLRVSYTNAGDAPRRLFLKFSLPDHPVSTPERGHEVLFYRHVAGRTPGPLVRCFDAEFSAERARLHILLEDLGDSHYSEPASQLPPSDTHCYRLIEAIAAVHAAWWEQPPWEVLGMRHPDGTAIDHRISDVRDRVERFVAFLGDRLSSKRRDAYRDVLVALPRLYDRLLERRAYTVVHDDLHIGNVLYPSDPDNGTLRIIDWQTWHVDLGPKDMAHAMALFWFPERRRRLELPLLRRYHESLQAHGVTGYSWERCWADYRLCVLRKLFHPAWQWDTGHHPNIWWNHMERVWAAVDDLGCIELVEK